MRTKGRKYKANKKISDYEVERNNEIIILLNINTRHWWTNKQRSKARIKTIIFFQFPSESAFPPNREHFHNLNIELTSQNGVETSFRKRAKNTLRNENVGETGRDKSWIKVVIISFLECFRHFNVKFERKAQYRFVGIITHRGFGSDSRFLHKQSR